MYLFAYDHVQWHPENGTLIIEPDKIIDRYFKDKGWFKMDQKINGLTVYYMAIIDKNGKMKHIMDFKIKD